MIHLGDITKLHGDAIPPVDCITGGSPCQDLSVAGKRAGLVGERSGLFMEQIRIVKEMRERDIRNGRTGYLVRPRYMVWENVPGAFSSNKGADFQAVLTEIVKIVEPDVPDVPLPDKGKWPHSGCLYSEMGDWSVAWRVHDAKFWGVPQRRKRIALVADFGGLAAPEVLFERKGLSGDPEPSGAEGQRTTAAVEGSAGGAGFGETGVGYWQNGIQTLRAEGENRPSRPSNVVVTAGVYCLQGNGIDRADTAGCNGKGWREDQSYTLNTIDRPAVYIPDVAHALSARHDGSPQPDKGNGANIVAVHQNASGEVRENDVAYTIGTNANASGRNTPLVYDARGNGDGETAPTMTGDHQNRVTDYTAVCVGNGQLNQMSMKEQANALDTMHDQQAVMIAASLSARDYKGPCCQDLGNNMANYPIQNSVVRRLTPLECERLQGYPDGWTDIGDWLDSKGKKHKDADSPRYKALGNSIALPFWQWMARRICAQYERPVTMASLFDGIGGFPLVFQRCGAVPVWASEIEEFPIAVTKAHFPEVGAT